MGSSNTPSSIVLFVWLLLVGSLGLEISSPSISIITRASAMSSPSVVAAKIFRRDDEHQVPGRDQKLVHSPESNLNYMMDKRGVPNGPDPIHNRRAGNSKWPPGRA